MNIQDLLSNETNATLDGFDHGKKQELLEKIKRRTVIRLLGILAGLLVGAVIALALLIKFFTFIVWG